MLRAIISVGIGFDDYVLLKRKCDNILKSSKEEIELVLEGNKGADILGERYAKENDYNISIFNANFDDHGKAAVMIRNAEMVTYADSLIAFVWKESIGTSGMISLARKKGIPYRIINVNKMKCKHLKKWKKFVSRGVFWCDNCRKMIDKSMYIKKGSP